MSIKSLYFFYLLLLMDNKLILIIAVVLLFILYQKLQNKEKMSHINDEGTMSFFDETILRIRCQSKKFNWEEPYLNDSSKESIGTGFFIDDQGHILTNYHVIEESIKIYVQIPKFGNKTFDCEIISVYPKRDVALLKINNKMKTKYLKMGDSDDILKGNLSYAVGYPLGQNKYKVTSGVVSGYQDGDIQMDTAINPGNSGGPLVTENLEVIGINYSAYSSAQNVGYAIPINYVKVVLDNMFKNKIIRNPVLGCSFNNTNESILKFTKLCKSGYYVSFVGPDSPMDNAGIKPGNIICSVDGIQMDNYGELFLEKNKSKFHIFDYLNYKKVGDKISFDIVQFEDDYKIVKKDIILKGDDYYKIRHRFVNYENVDYQIIGGMVIMELGTNHFDFFEKKKNKNKNIMKFNRIDEFIESKLIITKIIKGSSLAEDNIFLAPCILDEVNGNPVKNLKQLRKELPKFKVNNGNKYISFHTEHNKFIVLDIGRMKEEEKFLSKKFNYEITDYTKKLLGFYEVNKVHSKSTPAPTMEEQLRPVESTLPVQ